MRIAVNLFILLVFFLSLFLFNSYSRGSRRFPKAAQPMPAIVQVTTEKDVYAGYKEQGLWGAHVVHMNRHMNMVVYFPPETTRSVPFPVRASDVRPVYEKSIDSHNWLFIAARSGMVRAVTSVLAEDSFRERFDDLRKVPTLSFGRGYFRGFTYDIPWAVATIDTLPFTAEPVVVTIDAGFFLSGADPSAAALSLKKKLTDVRMIALITSDDEPDVTEEAKRALKRFEAAWKGL